MGILDKVGDFLKSDIVKNGVREMMVARPTDNDDLIWKYPKQSLPMFAQCTVRADEWAVFTKEQRPVGTLDSGRSTLSTVNIPFLSNLVDQYAVDSLLTELYFVRRIPFTVIIDGDMGVVFDPSARVRLHPRCTGKIEVQVENPEKLLAHCMLMHWQFDRRSTSENIATVAMSMIRSASLKISSEQHQTVPAVLCDHSRLSEAVAQDCGDMAVIGLRFLSITSFDFDLPPNEFDSVRLAMQPATGSPSVDQPTSNEPTLPPLMQQVFERGVLEGELIGRRMVLQRLLVRAGIKISEEHRLRIQLCVDSEVLDGWAENVLAAATADDVFAR